MIKRRHMSWLGLVLMLAIVAGLPGMIVGERAAAQDNVNLLANGGLERPYYGVGAATRTAPNGWNLWVGAGAPEAFPHTDATQVRDGEVSWNLKQGYTAFTAAGWQRVSGLTAGETVTARGYGWVYTCNNTETSCIIEGYPYRRSDPAASASLKIGIDPTGGTDPLAASVVWSGGTAPYDQWAEMTVAANVQGDAATVFLYMSQGQGLALNNVYWDQISLTRGGTASQPGGTPGSTVVPTPPAEVPFVVPQGVRPDGSIIHIVQEGDTLSSIAFAYYEDYGTTVALIAEFNEGIQPNTRFLTIGQEIIILPPGSVDPATGQLLPEDERGTPRAASTAEATEESDASGTAEATEEATAAASITPVATATPRSVAQQTTVPLPPLPGQPTQAGAIGAQAASTAEAEPEPTEEATEAAAEEPVETTPEPTAVALAEVPPAGDAASGLIAADGTLCVSVYQDVNQNQVRDEGEASVPGGEIVLQPPDAAATNYPYTEGDDPLCLDLLPGRYEVQAALPEGYGMTTAETALVTLVRGREVRVAFGGAEGYTPPAVPEAPAEDDAPEAESLETGAVAPMVEVSADGDDEDQSALDRIYDNSGLFVLGFAGVVLVSGAALILALRRFGR